MCDLCDDQYDDDYYDEGSYDNITFEPVPVSDFGSVEYGLLTPQGLLFACDYYGHSNLTEGLRDRGILERNYYAEYGGSIHISDGEFDFIGKGSQVTQKQLDAMFDYAIAHEIQFDFAQLEVVDEKVKNGTARAAARSAYSVV